jgi:hypothetical protein
MPYDPYPWCAVYGGDAGGASNCGFLTIEQCRATVSGIGGFCEPNSVLQSVAGCAPKKVHAALGRRSLTIEQCRATVSGIGGSCTHNQFYNPKPAARPRKRQAN